MKKINEEVKKNVATGASTAAGAVAGVALGSILTPEEAQAAEAPEVIEVVQPVKPAPAPKPQPVEQEIEVVEVERPVDENTTHSEPKPEPKPEPQPEPQPEPEPDPEPEITVVGYDRQTLDDGSVVEVAVLNVQGNHVEVIDVDLDNKADLIITDHNHNQSIDQGEVEDVSGQGMSMQPFKDAVGYNPALAENHLPDYVNNADVDTYLG